MKHYTVNELIVGWGKIHSEHINEIFVVGSCARNELTEQSDVNTSDLDLMIFICDTVEPELLYEELAIIGLKVGVLIHPLFICESDKRSKLSITLYSDALNKGRRLL